MAASWCRICQAQNFWGTYGRLCFVYVGAPLVSWQSYSVTQKPANQGPSSATELFLATVLVNLEMPNTPLDAFFASYPSFSYDPSASATGEFKRMCEQFGWGRTGKRKKRARAAFRSAMIAQFNQTFGTDVNSLRSWQSLCEAIDMDEIPNTLKDCKKAVAHAHVNLVDLLDAARRDQRTKRFPSERALSEYTIAAGRFFPRDEAKAGGLLRYLLRYIFSPSDQ